MTYSNELGPQFVPIRRRRQQQQPVEEAVLPRERRIGDVTKVDVQVDTTRCSKGLKQEDAGLGHLVAKLRPDQLALRDIS